jgi:hypothetical protein
VEWLGQSFSVLVGMAKARLRFSCDTGRGNSHCGGHAESLDVHATETSAQSTFLTARASRNEKGE